MSNQFQFKFLDKRISTPVGILIIILVAILAGGIMAWQYLELQKEEAKMQEIKVPNEEVKDETTSWKTYSNEEYGFEVRYPHDWELEDWKIDQDKHLFELSEGICEGEPCTFLYACEFGISISEERPFEVEEQFVGQTIPGPYAPAVILKDKEEFSIREKLSATKFYNSEFPGTEIYFLKEKNNKGHYFKISTVVWEAGSHDPVVAKEHKCGEIFNQMLSNFRFIEVKKETSDEWKTRKNKIYGFKVELDGQVYREEDRKVDDLDKNGQLEVIISFSSENYETGYIYIFTILDEQRNYKEIGRIESGSYLDFTDINQDKSVEDINNDGLKEVFLYSIERGGTADRIFYRILNVDFNTRKLNFIKLQDEAEKESSTFKEFGYRGRGMYERYIFNKDFNDNGEKEIIKFSAIPCEMEKIQHVCLSFCELECEKFKVGSQWMYEDGEWSNCIIECNGKYKEKVKGKAPCDKCKLWVYEWNGSVFRYNNDISKIAQKKMDIEEFSPFACDTCIKWVE